MYKVFKNTNKVYTSINGTKLTVPRDSEYSVYWVKNGHKLLVLDIKDHFIDPKSIGNGIAAALNKGKIVLDLK